MDELQAQIDEQLEQREQIDGMYNRKFEVVEKKLDGFNKKKEAVTSEKQEEFQDEIYGLREEVGKVVKEGQDFVKKKANVIHSIKQNIVVNTETISELFQMKKLGKTQVVNNYISNHWQDE